MPLTLPPPSSSLAQRLWTVFALTLGIAFVGAGYGVWSLDGIADRTRRLTDESFLKERLVADCFRNVAAGLRRTTAIAVSTDATLADFFADDIRDTTKSSNELLSRIATLLAAPDEKQAFDRMNEARKAYLVARDKVAAQKKAGEAALGRETFEQAFRPAAAAYQGSLQGMIDLERRRVDVETAEIEVANRHAVAALITFGCASLLLGGVLAAWLNRSISRPIRAAVSVAHRIAALDLTQTIEIHDRDETGQLLQALESMQGSLRGLVEQIRRSTDNIGTASAEIADGNLDLSMRTEKAASSLQQTAAAMLDMQASVQQSAGSVGTASALAATAAEVAARGGKAVAEVVATMNDIKGSSQRIADITGVIDGIAFQTNILALNAAVEAARAGPEGRGFAVVAAEVRLLAQRSAQAAKEIKVLIGASVGKVEAGTLLVAGAGATIDEVVQSARRVAAVIQEVRESAEHQNDNIGRVNAAVAQLDHSTQENAALVEQAAAAAASLKAQTAELAGTVQRFST